MRLQLQFFSMTFKMVISSIYLIVLRAQHQESTKFMKFKSAKLFMRPMYRFHHRYHQIQLILFQLFPAKPKQISNNYARLCLIKCHNLLFAENKNWDNVASIINATRSLCSILLLKSSPPRSHVDKFLFNYKNLYPGGWKERNVFVCTTENKYLNTFY